LFARDDAFSQREPAGRFGHSFGRVTLVGHSLMGQAL